MAVAGGDVGIGRFAIDLARRRRCRESSAWPRRTSCRAAAFQTSAPRQTPSCVSRSSVKACCQVSTFGSSLACSMTARITSLPGGVAQGVDDAVVAVAPFAPRARPPASSSNCVPQRDQFVDPRRRLAHDHLDDGRHRTDRRRRAACRRCDSRSDLPGSITPAMPPWA